MRLLRATQSGQGTVEYGLTLTMVALVVLTLLLSTGRMAINLLSNVVAVLHQAGL